MLSVFTAVQALLVTSSSRLALGRGDDDEVAVLRGHGDAGQATAEYALVLVGAAAVALLLIGWAAKTDKIGKLFEAVVDSVAGRVK